MVVSCHPRVSPEAIKLGPASSQTYCGAVPIGGVVVPEENQVVLRYVGVLKTWGGTKTMTPLFYGCSARPN